MFMRLVVGLLLTTAIVFFIGCGGRSGETATWTEFRYNLDDGEEIVPYRVQIKITDCTYELSPDGDISMSVEYALRNRGDAPIVYDWDDKLILDSNGELYEPVDGMSSRTTPPGGEQEMLYARYRLPQTVAVGGGMNRLNWGLAGDRGLQFRIHLKPRLIE